MQQLLLSDRHRSNIISRHGNITTPSYGPALGGPAQHAVSRKFVYRQAAKAERALDAAFSPAERDDEKVLFHVPVTKAWLQQLILGLTLICHTSLRGVVELLDDLFDYRMSVGTFHNVLRAAVARARSCNE